ncbi:C1 family peptidase [Bacteriovoracaceae bacterium]|nr:C1 family peptidase [Bacteriovoracaceae bacterium]
MKKLLFLTIISLTLTGLAKADTDSPLDPAYTDLVHPIEHSPFRSFEDETELPTKSDTLDLISKLSPVRAQGSRGTCSIFSAIALLEAMLVIEEYEDISIDLSEEYLEYVITRFRDTDGSNSYNNFMALHQWGTVLEESWEYDPKKWTAKSPNAQLFCKGLDESETKSCLLGHRAPDLLTIEEDLLLDEDSKYFDPAFLDIRTEALFFAENTMKDIFQYPGYSRIQVRTIGKIKELLNNGIPMTMGINFFYGAWNHRIAKKLGIKRDLELWNKGIVGYPAANSIDVKLSEDKPAGHSILIVGYDDEKTIEIEKEMTDGTKKTFTHKGVYYFKNSWGIKGFGKEFTLEGETLPGYGMITYDYAHEYGGFYQLPLL